LWNLQTGTPNPSGKKIVANPVEPVRCSTVFEILGTPVTKYSRSAGKHGREKILNEVEGTLRAAPRHKCVLAYPIKGRIYEVGKIVSVFSWIWEKAC